jgi:hypothetical protein
MIKIHSKLAKWWKAETPLFARILQSLSVALATLPLYYQNLPQEFKSTIEPNILHFISIAGMTTTFLFQFFTKKQAQ